MAEIRRRQFIQGAAAVAVGAALTEGRTSAEAAPAPGRPAPSPRQPACTAPGGRDFPKVGGNLGNQNYSGLGRIRPATIRRLGATWVNRIEGGLTTGTNQSTAVAVDGVLFIESALGN